MRTAAMLSIAMAAAAARPAVAANYGILLLAHGGDPSWNAQVLELRSASDARVPTEVAFGMADPAELSQALKRLQGRGPAKVVAVPLFVNSASEVLEQTRYALGLKDEPSETMRQAALAMAAHGMHGHHHMFSTERALSPLPLVMTPALDDHPLVASILLERAKTLSKEPASEVVVLVGHGPVDEKAVKPWEETMGKLAAIMKKKGRFKGVKIAMLRDDAPALVRAAAVERLRGQVAQAGASGGRVLVIPYLIAQGGIEEKIVTAIDGLKYEWNSKTIMPHRNIGLWLAEVSEQGSKASDMRLIKKEEK